MGRFDDLKLAIVLTVASSALAGCHDTQTSDWDAGPSRVCVDPTGVRVDDQTCPDTTSQHGGGGGAHWVYFGGGRTVPRIGAMAAGASSTPEPGVAYVSAPAEGISRGGFGGTAHGAGGERGGEGGAGE